MPRRILRSSWLNKSPLLKHNSSRNAEAFMFESETIQDPISPNTTNLKASSTEEKNSKKARRKLIRYTQDLNVLMTDDTDSDVGSKTKAKSKKTKRMRLPSFLPPIETLDENIKMPLASGSTSTDSDNKENENKDEENLGKVLRSSRRRKKFVPLKEDFGQVEINESKKTCSSGNSDSDTKDSGNQSDATVEKKSRKPKRKKNASFKKDLDQDQVDIADEEKKTRPSLSGSSTDTDEKVTKTNGSETMSGRSSRKKNSLMEKGPDQSNDDSNKEQPQDNAKGATTSSINSSSKQTASKSTLRREGTFNITLEKSYISRETLDISSTRLPSEKTGQEICDSVPTLETVDLTESVARITPSPRKLRRTFDKDPTDNKNISLESGSKSLVNRTNTLSPVKKMNRNTTKFSSGSRQSLLELSSIRENKISTGTKSSFEISFNFNKEAKQEQVLDQLNITRRESRNSKKKSSTGMQYSTDIEDDKNNFITLRRQCHSLMDFEAANSFNDSTSDKRNTLWRSKTSAKLNNGVEETDDVSLERKSLAKQPSPRKGILRSGRSTRDLRKNTTFEFSDDRNEALEIPERRSVVTKFRTTEATPNKSQQVGAYRDIFDVIVDTPTVDLRDMLIDNVDSFALIRTVANETNMSDTFTMDDQTQKRAPARGRSSSRKRWSQVEKTPVFDKVPPCSRNDSQLDANFSITKSVRFGASPPILSFAAQSQAEEKKPKAKKSVKIESPLNTPKMRLHSPLVMRKTPKPDFSAGDNSILASNCAYSLMSPSSSSTPFPKKKEVSLLHEVLTNEKNKAEKAIKSSSRVKMPNFRKIHEKQFEKMENIKELQERKAARAQYLMSGCKIPSAKNTPGGEGIESRKKLLFSPLNTAESNKKDKKMQKSALPKIVKPEFKKRTSLEKKKNELKSKLPVVIKNLTSLKSGQLQTITQQSGVMKTLSKPQQHLLYKRVSLDKKKPERKPETKPLSRFGFKQGKQVTKESQIKAVATKSKLTVNRTEENRKNASSVRTNRRFELLMQFRGKK